METHTELLAAASSCRQSPCESTEPVGYLQGSGQVVAREAGQVTCCPPVGCCRDRGTHRAATLPCFLVVGGSHRSRVLPWIPRPKTPAVAGGEKPTAARLGLGTIYPAQRVRGGGCNEMPPPLGTALPCPAGKGAQTHSHPCGAKTDSYPWHAGLCRHKPRVNFCTRERLGSLPAAERTCPCSQSNGWSVHPSWRADRGEQPAPGLRARGLKRTAQPGLPGVWV